MMQKITLSKKIHLIDEKYLMVYKLMKIILKDKKYIFLIGYQKQKQYREAFNNLAESIFPISFEEWFQAGYWNEKYIPYTLFDGDKAVANISVNIMDFSVFGEQKNFIQIGTVMTDANYRNKGLSRFLMEKVLDEWNHKCDLIYLYANPSVLEMYPKFGFKRVKEYSCFKHVKNKFEHTSVEKLNMDQQLNRDKLYNLAKHSEVFGRLSMKENADLVMFYCTSFLKESVYYIQSLDVIAVATYDDHQLQIWDVFGEKTVELDQIIYSLMHTKTNEVLLGFTPHDCSSYNLREIKGNDTLFVQQNKTVLFDDNKLMFPLLSHA